MVKLRARQANNWRLKFEKEGVAKIEELESTKMKLQVLVMMVVVIVEALLLPLATYVENSIKSNCFTKMKKHIPCIFLYTSDHWSVS